MREVAIALLVVTVLGTGCAEVRHIELVDLDTFDTVSFHGGSEYWDVIVPTAMYSQHVYHMFRVRDDFKLVKRNLKGDVVKEETIPLFSPWYTSTPFALKSDESGIAYHKNNTQNLYLYDFATRQETLLAQDIASNEFHIKGLAWIDNKHLVAILEDDKEIGRIIGEVVKLDANARRIVGRLDVADPNDFCLSPTGRLLAIAQMIRGGVIKIIDLQTLSVTDDIPNTNKQSWMHEPAWNPDETALAYIDGNHWLSIFMLGDRSSKRIMKIPDKHVCYFVGFPKDSLLVYESGPSGGGRTKMYFVDVASRKIIKSISRHFNGKSEIIANGKKIASDVGY